MTHLGYASAGTLSAFTDPDRDPYRLGRKVSRRHSVVSSCRQPTVPSSGHLMLSSGALSPPALVDLSQCRQWIGFITADTGAEHSTQKILPVPIIRVASILILFARRRLPRF